MARSTASTASSQPFDGPTLASRVHKTAYNNAVASSPHTTHLRCLRTICDSQPRCCNCSSRAVRTWVRTGSSSRAVTGVPRFTAAAQVSHVCTSTRSRSAFHSRPGHHHANRRRTSATRASRGIGSDVSITAIRTSRRSRSSRTTAGCRGQACRSAADSPAARRCPHRCVKAQANSERSWAPPHRQPPVFDLGPEIPRQRRGIE